MKSLTKSEAEQLAGEAPSKQSGVMPSLLILYTTEAKASKERAEAEKLLADPDISDEDFNKLLQTIGKK